MMASRRNKRTFTDEFRPEVGEAGRVGRQGLGKGALTIDERDELQELR